MTLDTAGLTSRQAALLCYIAAKLTRDGISPSHDEMQAALGLRSKSTITELLEQLEARGKIRFTARVARSVVLLPDGPPRYQLRRETQERLSTYCRKHDGELPNDVVDDAVSLHLDALDGAPATAREGIG